MGATSTGCGDAAELTFAVASPPAVAAGDDAGAVEVVAGGTTAPGAGVAPDVLAVSALASPKIAFLMLSKMLVSRGFLRGCGVDRFAEGAESLVCLLFFGQGFGQEL